MELQYTKLVDNQKNRVKLSSFLHDKSGEFAEPLESRISISDYTEKILKNGYVFAVIDREDLVGVIGGYANDYGSLQAYESILITDKSVRGSGAAKRLFQLQSEYCREQGMNTIYFTTNRNNKAAVKFYEKMNVPVVEGRCDEKVIGYVLPINH